MAVGIVFSFTLFITGMVFLLLLYLGIIAVSDATLAKSVLLIAIAVVSGVMLLVAGCCCLDCLRTEDIVVSTTFNRDGKSHRSRRSRKSSYHRSDRSRSPVGAGVVVVSI